MANTNYAGHGTLVATVQSSWTLLEARDSVIVTNRSGSADIYFTVDTSNAAVTGANNFVVPNVAGATKEVAVDGPNVTVNLISAGTPTYSVESRRAKIS